MKLLARRAGHIGQVNITFTLEEKDDKLLKRQQNRTGPSTEPCGTPHVDMT